MGDADEVEEAGIAEDRHDGEERWKLGKAVGLGEKIALADVLSGFLLLRTQKHFMHAQDYIVLDERNENEQEEIVEGSKELI